MSTYGSLPHFFFFFVFNHSKSASEHRRHHFLPSGTIWLWRILLILLLILPAYLLLISLTTLQEFPPRSFLWLRKHPQTTLAVCYSVRLLSLPLSSPHTFTACLSLSVALPSSPLFFFFFFTPSSVFVADSSAPQEHRGEQRKQRFGSVALILIFCRLDGRLGGAFIHTPHNHFPLQLQTMTADHRGCSYQHKCAICDKASLCFLPKTMTGRGTKCAEHRSQGNGCEMQNVKESRGKKKGTMQCREA